MTPKVKSEVKALIKKSESTLNKILKALNFNPENIKVYPYLLFDYLYNLTHKRNK